MDRHRSHHQQYTQDHRISTFSTRATSTRSVHSNTARVRHFGLRGFRSTKCSTGLDANAKLASHSDGFSVENAVPNSDMTAGDEERTTFFVNVVAKNGLVAQNTRTAAAAPQADMYARKRVEQTRDTGQSHSWNTGGLDFEIRDSQNQKLQS